MGSDTSFST